MAATSLPLQFDQDATPYNLRSLRGMPISAVSNSPAGSDGRQPSISVINESGTFYPATTNQFTGLVSFGGGLGLVKSDWQGITNSVNLKAGTTAFSLTLAKEMKLPWGQASLDSSDVMIQRRAQIGSPYLCRAPTCLFGSVITVPSTDERSVQLAAELSPTSYWQPEPYTTNGHASAGYYWSPNAGVVYATQPGPIAITWKKASPYQSGVPLPAYTNQNGTASFVTESGNTYLLYTVQYVVSSSAVKKPRKMYWTEGAFQYFGKRIALDKTHVPGGVKIVYNSCFPKTVEQVYAAPGEETVTNRYTNPDDLLKTFYASDDNCLHANNAEGRVFMELLGDVKQGGHESLGFEIVDIFRQPAPVDVTTELGEQLQPPLGMTTDEVTPELLNQTSFTFQRNVTGSDKVELFATRPTATVNDCLAHWLESGEQGLKWPTVLARYTLIWPDDVAKFSHYIRPPVATDAEAQQTAVALTTLNVPMIAYQDPCDHPRAKLTPEYKFYTFLDEAVPAHRTLLQFNVSGNVAFERVFSWLDGSLRSANFSGSLATELSAVAGYAEAWAAFTNQATLYSAYTNRLSNSIAYTNRLAVYSAYTNQVAAYSTYTNTLTTYVDYTNRLGAYVSYTNQLTTYVNYTNQLAAYIAYTNYTDRHKAYTNYLASRSRGVNTEWKLYAGSFAMNINTGTVASWSVNVITTNAITGLATNRFTGGSMRRATSDYGQYSWPAPSAVTVSGITNDVVAIQVQMNAYQAVYASDHYFNVTGPTGKVCCIMADVGGYLYPNKVNCLIYDSAAQNCPDTYFTSYVMQFAGATNQFRPTVRTGPYTRPAGTLVPTLNALLLEAPAPVANPGNAPASTNYPGIAPPIPGTAVPAPGAAPATPGAAPATPGAAPATPGTEPPAPGEEPISTKPAFLDSDLTAPRVVNATAFVGERLRAPAGEPGEDGSWAGHINAAMGDLFNPNAYIDPLASGFDAAKAGAIIPVNAIPGTNLLEVWWFRNNRATAGHNAGNSQLGFAAVYWPSVLGRYTLTWPTSPREIVLASNLGSGTLDTFEAQGSVYCQNSPALPGYNPNEEHALMSGGTAYALRDDLNVTNAAAYSSHPFVLLNYTAQDGRPAMSVFRVLREKPEAGYVFDYVKTAGQLLQPPMPLAVMAKPVEGSGERAVNYNTEPDRASGDLPSAWNASRDASGLYGHYGKFTWQDRKHDVWVYRGQHAGLPALKAGCYDVAKGAFAAMTNTAVVARLFRSSVHVSRQPDSLRLSLPPGAPQWLSVSGLDLIGTPESTDIRTSSVQVIVTDSFDNQCITNTLVLSVAASGSPVVQNPLSLTSVNPFTGTVAVFSGRPPFLAVSPTPTNSFTMRYYYKTEASFAWPNDPTPPETGSIVPYLRPVSADGRYAGDGSSKLCAALDIVYRPVWPVSDVPTMSFGQTLAETKNGLPGLRDWKSAEILYQQSVASNITNASPSAVLFDPTREKTVSLASASLEAIPASIASKVYQGKTYFPNLPPHLASRLFYDPNRGTNGSVVLTGEFKKELMGESYFLLNVLRDSDLAAAKSLCPSNSSDAVKWNGLIDALSAQVETYHESPDVPGTYVADPTLTVSATAGDVVKVNHANTMVDSYALSASGPGSGFVTLVENSGTANTDPGDPVALHIIKVDGALYKGELKILPSSNPLSELVTFQHTADLAGHFADYEYEWKIAAPDGAMPPATNATMSLYLALTSGPNLPRYTLGGAGIQVLSDNYIVMRYRPIDPLHPLCNQWSGWTTPALCEGWIKRVLAGINPFSQRVTDLFNNTVNTDVSLLTQAGHRWEGDVALNADTLNNYGLIEIYETVLRRGRMLSIDAGYNYGPANDALLLAAGYLNDLYMMVGNEAWADAANPTIGIGTKDTTYGDVATALFAFKGQESSLLDEELALLRGRDDFLQPGVDVSPVYNRLVWNYTRGIDAGEVIYALNYNIQEKPDGDADGIVNAADAAYMFPQGHGDAYGHYLTALKGYYSLLANSSFDWVPRAEAVNILGKPVSVDYQDERKFAAAAVALGRAGRQVLDLTWRKDFQAVAAVGWSHLSTSRANSQTQRSRYWGTDHWATRTGQGTYLNWVVGNAILPDVDPNLAHEGIEKVDRTTVPELSELAALGTDLQTDLDNAEGGLTPLGMPEGAVAFDIDPNVVVGTDSGTHFEQVYSRAKVALNNAVASFDDAKDVTRLMRAEQDSLADFQAQVANQELAFNHELIELYGTPYPDDIGAGQTYAQGYAGPDIYHYAYVDQPEYNYPDLVSDQTTFSVDIQQFPDGNTWNYTDWSAADQNSFNFVAGAPEKVEFNIGARGFLGKPDSWTGRRSSPGKIQQDISGYLAAYNRLQQTLVDAEGARSSLDYSYSMFQADLIAHDSILKYQHRQLVAEQTLGSILTALSIVENGLSATKDLITDTASATAAAFPTSWTDFFAPAKGTVLYGKGSIIFGLNMGLFVDKTAAALLQEATDDVSRWTEFDLIAPIEWKAELRGKLTELANLLGEVQGQLVKINESVRNLDDADRNLRASIAKGDRIQLERQTFRRRAAVVVQGYRTRDAGFRIFRNEKLERYKTLFDLSARYALLAANAYDYETGLLNTDTGRSFINRIVSARALGVVQNGEPQYAGSDTGDPGLSSALAEMKADWDVLRGRLGFNNPDAYGTTVSLRWEGLRIRPSTDGDANWKDILQQAKMDNILDDSDVRKYCMQIDNGNGLSVPGIVLSFSTTVADGYNLLGQELSAGDHAFSSSSFATKIFAVGVALEGYRGMDNPAANSGAGGTSPSDPSTWYLDPLALAATPYVYLIPCGTDAMRSPPLGDVSTIRTWTVNDVAIPMPFNIGASDFSTKALWQTSDSLTEPLFAVRKHQAFRPVSTTDVFSPSLYGSGGTLLRSQYTNNRLVGRSVWNTQWKLVIPGKTLLNDPKAGLDRFIQTVKDAKLYFVTYSYSGN